MPPSDFRPPGGRVIASDTITTLRARGRRLTNLIRADGAIDEYDAARSLDLTAAMVDGLNALVDLLRQLIDRRDCCIVRGAIADPYRTTGVRRLLHPDAVSARAEIRPLIPRHLKRPRRWRSGAAQSTSIA